MAAKVEGVEGPTSTPQGVEGGWSRTGHPWVRAIKVGMQRGREPTSRCPLKQSGVSNQLLLCFKEVKSTSL